MAFDCFLQVDGGAIKGECQDDKHKDWIKLLSVDFGFSLPAVAGSDSGSMSGGRSERTDLFLTKHVDLSSIDLMTKLISGAHIPSMKIEMVQMSGDKIPVLVLELKDVLITTSNISMAGDGQPIENLTVKYGNHHIHYKKTDARGGLAQGGNDMGWDWIENKSA
jgi:type VI secretion system secreted protein Hcp